MLTKTLKIFILSTILIFSTLFNVNSIFAQENKQITYDSVTCSDFELCNKEPGATNIPQETQFFATNITNRPNSQDIFNYLCRQKSKNPNAIYISHTEENGHTEPLLAFAYENNGDIKYLSVNSRPTAKKSIKTLTCEIPPTETEEEKQARLQEEERREQEQERREQEEQERQQREEQVRQEQEKQQREESQKNQNQQNQTITYENITCSNFELCRNTENIDPQYKISSFVLRDAKLKSIYANNICKELTNNSNSNFIDFLEDNLSGEKVAFRYNEENQEKFVIKTSYNRYIKQITCEILPENQQNQENQNNQNQQTPPNEPVKQVIGCADPTAINHNSQANVHDERSCIYPNNQKNDITGSFDNAIINYGDINFRLTLTLSEEAEIIDLSKIQIWNRFKIVSQTRQNNIIYLDVKYFNDQRIENIECNSYELNIPANNIKNINTTNNNLNYIEIKNKNSISGSFRIVNCPEEQNQNTQNQDGENQDGENQNTETENQNKSTIKENGFYISIFDTDENGKQYINLANTIYLLGFITFFLFLFFLFFSFLKNSFLGARRR